MLHNDPFQFVLSGAERLTVCRRVRFSVVEILKCVGGGQTNNYLLGGPFVHTAEAHLAPKARSPKCVQYSAEAGFFFFRLNIKTFFLQVKVSFSLSLKTQLIPNIIPCRGPVWKHSPVPEWNRNEQGLTKKKKGKDKNIVQQILFNSLCRLGLWGTL